jgi:type I restriction enzyme S subunit
LQDGCDMELKPHNNQTNSGIIPNDWDVRTLGQIAQLRNGYAFKSASYHPHGDYKVITIANVQDGYMDAGECNRIISLPPDLQEHQKLRVDDILISMTGNVGRVCRVTELNCLLNQRVGMLVPTGVDSTLLFYLLSQRRFVGAMATKAKGGAQGNLSVADITEFRLPVPRSLPEQRAIAAALSDVDALLDGLDRLIAKKRDIKQGAMQQLLTGKTRLPGFHGEWTTTTFGHVTRHHSGNSTLIKGKLSPLPGIGLFPGYSASGQDVWCDHYEHDGNAIIVSAVGSRCGKVFVASNKWCAIANTHVIWPLTDKIDSSFLVYLINDESFWQKSGTGQPFILFKKSLSRPLRLPSLSEQTAIAAVLSDMDAELSVLEARRNKTRDLKQGMMQELLTGKTRLTSTVTSDA